MIMNPVQFKHIEKPKAVSLCTGFSRRGLFFFESEVIMSKQSKEWIKKWRKRVGRNGKPKKQEKESEVKE